MSKTKQLSVRMPVDLVDRLEGRASVAEFIVQAVREKLEREKEDEIALGLRSLVDETGAEEWIPMQVMGRND